MRDIKFRIWDGYKMDYEPPVYLISTASMNILFKRHEIVMQFTGIVDKEDLDIYEDDVLLGDNSVVYRAAFDNGSFVLYTEGLFLGDKSGEAQGMFPTPTPIGRFQMSSMRVIGNIHDNPELLK